MSAVKPISSKIVSGIYNCKCGAKLEVEEIKKSQLFRCPKCNTPIMIVSNSR